MIGDLVFRHGEYDPHSGKLKADVRQIWAGTGGVWPEGPHLYKVNGMYYLLQSEGGTSYNHSLTMARSIAACQVITELASASRTGPARSSNSTAPLM